MPAADSLLSEKPAVELEPYSQWSETNQIEDPLESQKVYADYLRTKHLEANAYDSDVEQQIRDGLQSSALENGLIDEKDPEAGKKLFGSAEPSFEEKLRNAQNTLPSDSPEWGAITQYKSFQAAIADRTDVPEEYLATGEEYRLKAEEAVAATSEDVLRMKIRNNEIPFAKVTKLVDGQEQTEILTSDAAAKMPLLEAIKASKSGGISLADTVYAQNELATPEGYSIPLYKVKRAQEASSLLQTLAKHDESVAAQIDGYAHRLATSEDDIGDAAKRGLNAIGGAITNVVGTIMGKGEEISKKMKKEYESEKISTLDDNSIIADVAKKINASGAIKDSEAYSIDEVKLALNQVGINEATNKGYFQFHDGKDEIGKNIRSYGYGLPQVSPALMANKAKFDEALAAREDISTDIKAKMEGQRQSFVDGRFSEFNKVLSRSDLGEQWMDTLQKSRAAGEKDSTTLETFLSNPKNYSEFSQRSKGIAMSVVDGFGQMLAAVPAVLGSTHAQDYLAKVAQDNSDRHEVANLFGVDFGAVQELAESAVPMLVDMAATTALSALTAPAAGVGGAAYLAAKQGARLTMKGLVKGMTSSVLREAAGETAEVAAKRLVTEGLIKQSVKDAGVNGAMAAIEGYSGQLANKLNIAVTSFIPAANREMGSSYGTMFNQLRKDPSLTREEAHDRALGGALASGLVTGLVTSAFGSFGHGGLDTALTKGLSRSEMKTMMERLINSGNKIPNSQFNEIITNQLKNTFKEYGYASLGKEVAKNAFDEGVEEGISTFINTFVQDATMNENTPMLERFNQTFHAFVIGGAMGAAVPAIQSALPTFNEDVKRNAARNLENKAIDDVTNKLNESGSPLSAEAVRVLLTSSARRREAAATAFAPAASQTVDVTATPAPTGTPAPTAAPKTGFDLQSIFTPDRFRAAFGDKFADNLIAGIAKVTPRNALDLAYKELRGAPTGTYTINPDADKVTAVGNKDINVTDQSGWHYRIPVGENSKITNRVSLNIGFDPDVISKLDSFITANKLGYYKTPNDSANWATRHDPVTLYLNKKLTKAQTQEVLGIIGGAIRTGPTVNSMSGTKIADGVYAEKSPSKSDVDNILAKANGLDTKLGEAVKAYFYDPLSKKLLASAGMMVAVNNVIDTYAANVPQIAAAPTTAQSTAQLNAALQNVTPADVQRLMSSVRPQEVKSTGRFDVGVYAPTDTAETPSDYVPVNSLDFKQSKPTAEKLGLDYNDFISSEVQQANSALTVIPKIDVGTNAPVDQVEVPKEIFVGDDSLVKEETDAINRIASFGYPVGISRESSYAMPSRPVEAGYYKKISDTVAKAIYNTYPVSPDMIPAGGKKYVSNRKITTTDPISGVRKNSSVTGTLDENGIGIFNNNPVVVAEMIRDGVPVEIPEGFDKKLNPSFVVRDNKVIDVLGPRADGKAGLVSMVDPIERSYTSEPNYGSLHESAGLASLFLDDKNNERIIPAGAPVINANGNITQTAGSATSVGELHANFALFMENALTNVRSEGVKETAARGETSRVNASTKLRELLGLRGGAELDSSFFDTSAQALHTEYMYNANLFEVRNSLIDAGFTTETKAGLAINEANKKAAVKLFESRLRPEKKSTIAERLAPFVNATAEETRKNPNGVIESFIDQMILKNERFTGNVMPTLERLSNTIKSRYAEQQDTRQIEERAKVTVSMDPTILDQTPLESLEKSAEYIGEVSTATPTRTTPKEVSTYLNNAHDSAVNAIDSDGNLRDALNDLVFQAIYKNPSPSQVNRVKNMTTTDVFGTLVNWISKGNYDHPEILSFERSLRRGEYDAGNELSSALNLVRMSSRTSLNGDPTKDAGYVRAVKSELARSLGSEVSDARAKDFIKAIDKSMRKRMSRSHITAAQVRAAVQLNTVEASKLGLENGDPQSVINALQSVAKTSTNESHKLVAKMLLEDTNFIKTIKFEIGSADHSIAGEYNRLTDGTHSVFINMNGYNGRGLTNVLLEEYVHAFLSDVSNKPKESLTEKQNTAITRLKGLYDLVQKQADAQNITDPTLRDGLENIDEFIASFLLSQDFQALVKSVKPPTGQRGFFGRIIDSIVSLFRKVTGTEKDAYTQAMQDVLDLSRSAMRSDRLNAKSLLSSVANDAATMLNRAADVHDALPDVVKGISAKLDTVDQVKAYLEEQAQLVKEANDRDIARLHSEVTTDKLPQSLNETTEEQTAKAKTLLTIIRNMVPSEVRLRMLTKAEVTEMGDSGRFIASALADEITINPERMMAYVDSMDTLSAGKLIQSIITEELGHVASYNALTNSEIGAIADSLSDGEYDRIAEEYYQTDAERNAAKDNIRSEDSNKQRAEKTRLVEEHLRAHLQRATSGNTSEENAAFYRTNPSLFKIALRYVGNAFRKMTMINKNTGNDLIDAALTNMLVEMKALKLGYRNGPATLAFDPKNPSKSIEVIRALAQMDNSEMLEDAAFNEDVAAALQSQIGLDDFRRIQKMARGTTETEAEEGVTETIPTADVVDFLVSYFNGESWPTLVKMYQDGFESAYSFVEEGGEYLANPIGDSGLPILHGDPETPEVVEYDAAVAYLSSEFSSALVNFEVNGRALDSKLISPLSKSLAEAVILDAGDLGFGVTLTINPYFDQEAAEDDSELVVKSNDVTAANRKEIDLPKLKEVILQIDGMKLYSEYRSAYTDAVKLSYEINRSGKQYTLDFDVKPDKTIHVGSLFPVIEEGQKTTGETVSNDSFGTELIMALITSNHLIGAKSIDTFAAGSGNEIYHTLKKRKSDREAAEKAGKVYNPPVEMLFKGYKAWPKIGFDGKLNDSFLNIMADTQDLLTPFASKNAKDEWIKMVSDLATNADGERTLTQLIHLGKDPKAGSIIWSNTGIGFNVVFDLTAGSSSMQALGNIIEGHAPKSVKEVGDLRKVYSKKLKFLAADADLSDADRAAKIEETTETYKSALRALDIVPDRLLTSLGSGMNFDGSSMNFDALIETLETPIFEEGTYQAPKNTFMRALIGELDPRIRRLDDNRKAFNRAAALLVTKYKATLDKAVDKEKPPAELVAAAMGSTGVELQPEVYDRAEDAHTARLIAIRNNTALTEDERTSEIYASKQLLDQELYDARDAARKVIVKRKDEALAKLATIAPQTALHITNLRSQLIDPISKRLKTDYGVTESLGVHIDDQLGIYMTRAYKMFNEVGFADRVLKDKSYQEVRERAIDFFNREFIKNESRRLQREDGLLPADADIKAKDKLENKKSSSGQSYGQKALISFIEGYANKTSSSAGAEMGEGYRVMLNNLKKKRDIPFELREVLGEYKNSEEGTNNLLRTFTTVATMAANQSFLNNVRDLGMKNGFLVTAKEIKENKDPKKYEGFVPFRQSASSKYDPLLGMYAPKEMVEGFHKTFDSNTLRNNTNSAIDIVDKSMTVLTKATGYAMAAKTLGSAGFYMRNVLSNMLFFGPAQGFVRLDNMIKVASQYTWAGLKDQNRIDSYIAELTALNMIGDEYQSSMIRDMINGKVDQTGIMKDVQDLMDKAKVTKLKSAVNTLVDKAQRLAAAGDAVFKIAYFENEYKLLKEAQKKSNTGSVAGMSDYQLKRMAAEKVLMTAQSASRAPKVISEFSKSGLGLLFAPFVRFKAEIPRITINTYKLAMTEMKDANPDIKSRGIKRFSAMTTMLAGVSMALPTVLRVLVSGIGDDEDEALRNSIPEYLRGHTFNYFGTGDNLKSIDLTTINPFSMETDPALRALEQMYRGNFGKAASQYMQGMIFNQYLDDQIFASAYSGMKNNKNDTTGEPIWEEGIDNTGEILVKGLSYLMDKAYTPRIVQDAVKAYDAIGGDYKDFDKSPIGLMLTGAYPVRIHDVDINKQYSRYLSEKKEQFDRITKKKYAAYADKPMTEDRIRQLYDDELNDRRLLNQDLLKISRGFEGLGMTPQDIYKNMTTRGGVSKRRANLLFQNIMDRPALNKDFFTGLLKRDFGEERAKVLVDQMDSHPRYMFIEE